MRISTLHVLFASALLLASACATTGGNTGWSDETDQGCDAISENLCTFATKHEEALIEVKREAHLIGRLDTHKMSERLHKLSTVGLAYADTLKKATSPSRQALGFDEVGREVMNACREECVEQEIAELKNRVRSQLGVGQDISGVVNDMRKGIARSCELPGGSKAFITRACIARKDPMQRALNWLSNTVEIVHRSPFRTVLNNMAPIQQMVLFRLGSSTSFDKLSAEEQDTLYTQLSETAEALRGLHALAAAQDRPAVLRMLEPAEAWSEREREVREAMAERIAACKSGDCSSKWTP